MTEPKVGVNRGNAGKGRPKGSLNKSTRSLKELAREHTEKALNTLVSIMAGGEGVPPAAQVAAAKELLDRGYGKASTVLSGDEDGGPIELATTIELVGVRPGGEG